MTPEKQRVLDAAITASAAWESDDTSPENTRVIMKLMFELAEAIKALPSD